MITPKFVSLEQEVEYTGGQLRPHFLLQAHGLRGSHFVSFFGACDVKSSEMVDCEDRFASKSIRSARMIHVMGEVFGATLSELVLFQRLWIHEIARELESSKKTVDVRGNDIFIDDAKWNVSIVTCSPVSVLMHMGFNVDAEGAPVRAIGLKDLQLSEHDMRQAILKIGERLWNDWAWACAKVSPANSLFAP